MGTVTVWSHSEVAKQTAEASGSDFSSASLPLENTRISVLPVVFMLSYANWLLADWHHIYYRQISGTELLI